MSTAGNETADLREDHVRRYIESRGIRDARVLEAMRTIPREVFVPGKSAMAAYGDHPLPIDCGQTISQPYVVAWMSEALDLKPHDRVLEIGTGSGYQTAVLARLAGRVYTIEYHAALSRRAQTCLAGLKDICCICYKTGDGSSGWPEAAPFDAVCVTAGAPRPPRSLCEQLGEEGRLVVPVGDRGFQELVCITKRAGKLRTRKLGGCRFVPLWGREGWGTPQRAEDGVEPA